VQPAARLLLNIRRTCPLLLGFLQGGDLLLLSSDVAIQRGNLRPLTEQFTQRRGDGECKSGNNNREDRSPSGECRLAAARTVTAAVRHVTDRRTNASVNASLSAEARRSTVVCGRTAAGQRQPTTNRGNAAAPA